MIIFLWTDIFLWSLFFVSVILLFFLKRRPDFKNAFNQLKGSKIAIFSGLILLTYISIGLLDSIHFRPNVVTETSSYYDDTISVLDYIALPWSEKTEKTFSAPFAINSFVKERVVDDSNNFVEFYPSLEYVEEINSQGILTTLFFLSVLLVLIKYMANNYFSLMCKKKRVHTENQVVTDTILPLDEPGASTKNLGFDHIVYDSGDKNYSYENHVLLNHHEHEGDGKYSIKNRQDKDLGTKDIITIQNTHVHFAINTLLGILFVILLITIFYGNVHILGTDKTGQDILYVTLKSIRTGLIIGSLTSIFMLPLAILFGTAAGYFGGYIDDMIQYLYTTLSSIPGVLLISAFILTIQTQIALHPDWFTDTASKADVRLLALCLILGITSWSGLCRLIRAETLKLKQLDYVTAAKTMQVSNNKIIVRHIIPNLIHIIIISIAMDFSGLVLAEAVLSYIGVGVDPTTMSWGNMINSARLELSRDPVVWWPILGAFVPMFLFVLCLNLFADRLRDAFDPRIRV